MRTEREIRNRRLLEALDYIDGKYIDEALGILTVPPRSGEYVRDRSRVNKALAVFALRAACIMLAAGLVGSLPQILIGIGVIGPSQTSGPNPLETPTGETNFLTDTSETTAEETEPQTIVEDTTHIPDYGEILYSNVSDEGVAYSFYDGAIVISFGDDENANIPANFDLPVEEVRKHYSEGQNISFIVGNGVINMTYDDTGDAPEFYPIGWTVTGISFGNQTIETEPMGFSASETLYAFETDEAFVVSMRFYDLWSQTFILTSDSIYVLPDKFDTGNIYASIPVIFFKGEDGRIHYQIRQLRTMSRDHILYVWDPYDFLFSRDQYYGEDGTIYITDDGIKYNVSKTYTMSDYFVMCGTTIDEWFDVMKKGEFDTLDQFFAHNKKLMEDKNND